MADPASGTLRAAYDDLPAGLRQQLEAIARGERVEGHHGHRAGQALKLIGVLLGLAATAVTVVLVGRVRGLSLSAPLPAEAVAAMAVPASLGVLLTLRNLRRLVIDPKSRLSRWAFVTPSLIVRVELGGGSVLLDRLSDYAQGEVKVLARQQQGDLVLSSGEKQLRLPGFESVPALLAFQEAITAGLEHVRSRPDPSEDEWLARLDPSRAPPLPAGLPVALVLTVLSLLIGGAAVAIAHQLDLRATPADELDQHLPAP